MHKLFNHNFSIHKMQRDYRVVSVKRKPPNLFESIFFKNQGFNEDNLETLQDDLCVSPIKPNANELNQSCLLLHLWSKPFENKREIRLSYSAGPNMEQKNTFQVLQYMTRTWKKHTTHLPLPEKYIFTKQISDTVASVGENNFRLLTPELLGFTAGENWKNKKATLVVRLSQKSLLMLKKQKFKSQGKITYEDGAFVFRLTLPTDKSLQSIISNKKYPKAWIRNIYDEKKDDIQSSEKLVDRIYYDSSEYQRIQNYSLDDEDDAKTVALNLESFLSNKRYFLNETELMIFFNLNKYLTKYKNAEYAKEYDDKESFFKLIFEKTDSKGIDAYLVPLETENRRFNISNNFKIGLKILINVFHFIDYAYTAKENSNYVYL